MIPEIPISRKLLPALQSKKRFIVIVGGRGSGKSQGVADILLARMLRNESVACFREFQNSIDDSVYALLKSELNRLSLPGFSWTNSKLSHTSGSHAIFRGLARNVESVKSLHGLKIAWVEEAQTISNDSLKILTPTFREEGAQIIFTANLQSSEDAFSQRFIEPFISDIRSKGFYEDDMHLIIRCNYSDNPWFPKELEQERMWDKEHLSSALYAHIWEGEYNDTVEHAIIEADWFDATIDAHKELGFKTNGQIKAIHDPADSSDARAYVCRHGSIFIDAQETTSLDVNEACEWSCELAKRAQCDAYVWDVSGLGMGLRRQVNEYFSGTRVITQEFNGAAQVENPGSQYEKSQHSNRIITNRDAFLNLRAQMYGSLRDRFYRTYEAVIKKKYTNPAELISIDSNIELLPQIRAEVCRIPQVFNSNGVFQVMRKDQMKAKLKIKSPNLADCFMMSELAVKIATNKRKRKARSMKINVA